MAGRTRSKRATIRVAKTDLQVGAVYRVTIANLRGLGGTTRKTVLVKERTPDGYVLKDIFYLGRGTLYRVPASAIRRAEGSTTGYFPHRPTTSRSARTKRRDEIRTTHLLDRKAFEIGRHLGRLDARASATRRHEDAVAYKIAFTEMEDYIHDVRAARGSSASRAAMESVEAGEAIGKRAAARDPGEVIPLFPKKPRSKRSKRASGTSAASPAFRQLRRAAHALGVRAEAAWDGGSLFEAARLHQQTSAVYLRLAAAYRHAGYPKEAQNAHATSVGYAASARHLMSELRAKRDPRRLTGVPARRRRSRRRG